jgi:hypothetical protein
MSMKSLNEYLTESKKTYSFRIKVAGEIPESFEEKLHASLQRYGCQGVSKSGSTPIQKQVKDFPDLENTEVTMYESTCEYPVTPQEISVAIKNNLAMEYSHFRVRNVNDPYEAQETSAMDEPSGQSVLNDPTYKDSEKVKTKDYFGDDFNKSFLKDLTKASKDRAKETEYKMDKPSKQDKAGAKSAVGS